MIRLARVGWKEAARLASTVAQRPAGLANARTRLEKTDFPAGETTVMHEFVAHGTARPSATPHRFVAIKALLTNLAVPGLNPQ